MSEMSEITQMSQIKTHFTHLKSSPLTHKTLSHPPWSPTLKITPIKKTSLYNSNYATSGQGRQTSGIDTESVFLDLQKLATLIGNLELMIASRQGR